MNYNQNKNQNKKMDTENTEPWEIEDLSNSYAFKLTPSYDTTLEEFMIDRNNDTTITTLNQSASTQTHPHPPPSFWFNRDASLAIPAASLPHGLRINIAFESDPNQNNQLNPMGF